MKKLRNVLSLFDGISCGQIALRRAGIEFERYFASEIDIYAIKTTQRNFPKTYQLGDVSHWRSWDLDFDFSKVDLIFAGFPCQAWSFAGKQKGTEDPRGALVHTLLEVYAEIKKLNPEVKFLFENVRMKEEHLNFVNGLFGTTPQEINSSLVSAQNRVRLYWSNIPKNKEPLVDKKSYLRDVVEKNSGKLLSEKTASRPRTIKNLRELNEKSGCLLASMYKLSQSNGMTVIRDGGGLRCLTPLECERLQTIPEGYTQGISNSQRYKCIGNAWTVDIIVHLLRGLAGL